MEKKSNYESPETEIVCIRVFTPILQDEPIQEGAASMTGHFDAKQATDFEEASETIETGIPSQYHSIWEDEE